MKQLNVLKSFAKSILSLSIILIAAINVTAQNVYFRDDDRDGYGNASRDIIVASSPPDGYTDLPGDCDDWNSAINPAAPEVCNFQDDNCNGQVDEGCQVYYRDADFDGYGLWHVQLRRTTRPPGYSSIGGDCNDGNENISPGRPEICGNGINDDCDGLTDEGCFVEMRKKEGAQTNEPVALSEFKMLAYPNPGRVVNLSLQGDFSKGKITLRVLDRFGRLMETKNNLAIGQIIKLGEEYPNGVYIVEAMQGSSRQTIRISKLQ